MFTVFFDIVCNLTAQNVDIEPFAFRTHAHDLGRVVTGYKISPDGKWTLIGHMSPQEPQAFYPANTTGIRIQTGDTIAARCVMVSTCITNDEK